VFDSRCIVAQHQGSIMAKRKKASKLQKRAKVRRGNSAKRGKARRVAKAAKRTIAKAKPKRARVKKPAQKEVRPSALVVETVVVEKTTPDAIIVTEGLDPAA
jgi:hypothetical protein